MNLRNILCEGIFLVAVLSALEVPQKTSGELMVCTEILQLTASMTSVTKLLP